MEERMACGIGMFRLRMPVHRGGFHPMYNKRVCKDGPGILSMEVEL